MRGQALDQNQHVRIICTAVTSFMPAHNCMNTALNKSQEFVSTLHHCLWK